jgi:hypothetical protein
MRIDYAKGAAAERKPVLFGTKAAQTGTSPWIGGVEAEKITHSGAQPSVALPEICNYEDGYVARYGSIMGYGPVDGWDRHVACRLPTPVAVVSHMRVETNAATHNWRHPS